MTWYIDVSNRNIVRAFAVITGVLFIFLLGYIAREALSIFIAATFLAIATHKPVSWVATYSPVGGRKTAATAVFLLVAVVVGFVVYTVIPLLVEQGRIIVTHVPDYVASLRGGETLISQWLLEYDAFTRLETLLTGVFEGIVRSAEVTVDIVQALIRNAIGILFTILIGFALVVEGPGMMQGIDSLLAPDTRHYFQALRRRMFDGVAGFVNGQLIITTIGATATFILLTFLNVPAPLSLAAVVWLTGLIPLIGNSLGAIVVIIVTLSQSITVALFFIVFYVIYQQIENNILNPIIQAYTVDLTPLTVIISALIGVTLGGFVGALLAIPAGASIRAMAQYYFEHRGDTRGASPSTKEA